MSGPTDSAFRGYGELKLSEKSKNELLFIGLFFLIFFKKKIVLEGTGGKSRGVSIYALAQFVLAGFFNRSLCNGERIRVKPSMDEQKKDSVFH